MSDKTSQTTEEELLDQTFGPFDEALTGEDTPQTIEKELTDKGKKKSSNMLIYAGGGLAAVAVVGYVLMSGQEDYVVQQPVDQVVNVAPIQSAPIQPAQPAQVQQEVVQESFLANQNLNGNPLAGERLNEELVINPNAGNVFGGQVSPPVSAMNPHSMTEPDFMKDLQNNQQIYFQPSVPVTPNQEQMVNETITSVAPVVNTPSYENNLVQKELVQQLQQMFEKQTNDIKGSIEEINTSVVEVTKRVDVLESKLDKATEDQKEINKSLDERLAKLESGLQTKEIAKVEEKPAPKAAPKKANPAPAKKATPRKAAPVKSEVLVDKSKVQTQKAPVRAKGGTKIHSIFAGRVWTRNADGSLSTFVAGERLNGEVIKSIEVDSIIMESGRVIK